MTDKEKEAIERCKQLIKEEHSNWIGLSNQDAIETVLGLVEKYKYLYQKALDNTIKADRENLEKDKMIDEMTKHIKTTAIYECPEKDCEDDGSITCEDCIKEYFKKKVEEK